MKRRFTLWPLYRLTPPYSYGAIIFAAACCALFIFLMAPARESIPDGSGALTDGGATRSEDSVAITISAATAPQRGGTTYYVSPRGADLNPGTEAKPFRTIQKAADRVKPGDTVLVDDGVYVYSGPTDCFGRVVVCVSRGGVADNWVVFRSKNKWGAKIDGMNGDAASGFGFSGGASHVRIQDFEITGLASSDGSAGGIDLYNGGSDTQVVGNHIHDIGHVCANTSNGQNGVFIKADNVLVERNLIHDIGRLTPGQNGCQPGNENWKNHDHAIYHDAGDNVTILNNIIYNIKQGWAVQVWPKSRARMNILNNTIAFCNQYQGKFGAIVMWVPFSGGMKISDSIIANNIFYGVNTAAIWMGTGGGPPMTFANVRISNNIISNGVLLFAEKNVDTRGLILADSDNNMEKTDPKFADAGAFDFRLRPDSPAVDAGLTVSTPSGAVDDYSGRRRPEGARLDIGAYEYSKTSSPTHSKHAPQ